MVDQECEAEDNAECDNRPNDPVQADIQEILKELPLLQVIPTREYNRREQAIEKDLLRKIILVNIIDSPHDKPEDEADDDPDARLMDHVDLD